MWPAELLNIFLEKADAQNLLNRVTSWTLLQHINVIYLLLKKARIIKIKSCTIDIMIARGEIYGTH